MPVLDRAAPGWWAARVGWANHVCWKNCVSGRWYEAPGCFVVAEIAEDDPEQVPVPVLVTLSFDEANAYSEGGSTAYHVAIPAELYAWVEQYVLTQYMPEKKYKRRLNRARGGGGD